MACLDGTINDTTCKEIFLRESIKSEIDAINLYGSIAEKTSDERIKKTMLSVASEEKVHLGEFQFLLLNYFDTDQAKGLKKGEEEVLSEKTWKQ